MASYREGAVGRGLVFDLDKDQFRQLTSSLCYYCGCLPKFKKMRKSKHPHWGDYVYNGIDRMDNNIGYVMDNCVTCCRTCNRGKGAWPYAFWVNHIKQLAQNVLSNKVPCLMSDMLFDNGFVAERKVW